ncbi:hypothetical protein BDP27DRAFT_1431055 [Rhodocollybia butyracea]|uniref:GCM domain-containing protein n=1 Tax=Rhodocollybia butyracea TaxID=206335 RepID=A0A9P5PA89_9AGAR|nr:hypothetical protein BDP27DRAFT_1431055 [Rhodocollybia butyracea]
MNSLMILSLCYTSFNTTSSSPHSFSGPVHAVNGVTVTTALPADGDILSLVASFNVIYRSEQIFNRPADSSVTVEMLLASASAHNRLASWDTADFVILTLNIHLRRYATSITTALAVFATSNMLNWLKSLFSSKKAPNDRQTDIGATQLNPNGAEFRGAAGTAPFPPPGPLFAPQALPNIPNQGFYPGYGAYFGASNMAYWPYHFAVPGPSGFPSAPYPPVQYPGSANSLYMNNPAFWPPANMPGAAGGPIPLAMAPPPPLQPLVQPPMTGSQIRSEADTIMESDDNDWPNGSQHREQLVGDIQAEKTFKENNWVFSSLGVSSFNGLVAEKRKCLGVLECSQCQRLTRPLVRGLKHQTGANCIMPRCSVSRSDGEYLLWNHVGDHDHPHPPGGRLSERQRLEVQQQVFQNQTATAHQLRAGNTSLGSVPLHEIAPKLAGARTARYHVNQAKSTLGITPASPSKGSSAVLHGWRELQEKLDEPFIIDSQLHGPVFLVFQTDFMRKMLNASVDSWLDGSQVGDPEFSRHGCITDGDHSFFLSANLLATCVFNIGLLAWVPVLYTYMDGLDTSHHKPHFKHLFSQIRDYAGNNFEPSMLTHVMDIDKSTIKVRNPVPLLTLVEIAANQGYTSHFPSAANTHLTGQIARPIPIAKCGFADGAQNNIFTGSGTVSPPPSSSAVSQLSSLAMTSLTVDSSESPSSDSSSSSAASAASSDSSATSAASSDSSSDGSSPTSDAAPTPTPNPNSDLSNSDSSYSGSKSDVPDSFPSSIPSSLTSSSTISAESLVTVTAAASTSTTTDTAALSSSPTCNCKPRKQSEPVAARRAVDHRAISAHRRKAHQRLGVD